ncbi:MAG TPA: Fic family protein [Candidatus Saccharimonadales bacterium]|nr:Fic family protein [Candidatus Saccharimonadales bacterium]
MTYNSQLEAILQASGWSQEQLAVQLGVSFPTLNAWVNRRAVPRPKAQAKIQELYVSIVGSPDITAEKLTAIKKAALTYRMTAQKLVESKELLDKLTLHLTYHTNTIEGSTMTLADVEDVLFDNKVLTNRTAIEQLEARNHQTALYWLLDELVTRGRGFSVTEELITGIHLRLMNGIVGDAGRYRTHTVRIMGAHVPLANWQKVPELITQFINTLQQNDNLIELLARSHATFEKIHPFSDGNGRTGRLLILALALHAGYVPPLVIKERKQAYYKYLEIAQTKHNHTPLEFFVAESMQLSGELLAPE